MILIIDNYDSFTYNLYQYIAEISDDVLVKRNDKITLAEIAELKPSSIVLSPGPGRPEDAGICVDVIKTFMNTMPILGVCLGHQAIGEVFGGRIIRAKELMHGKTSRIYHNGKGLFKGLSNPFYATRYHSLVVERKSFPRDLEITAETKDKEIMGLRHKSMPIYGVQFHPESILTKEGKKLLKNFLKL